MTLKPTYRKVPAVNGRTRSPPDRSVPQRPSLPLPGELDEEAAELEAEYSWIAMPMSVPVKAPMAVMN